MIYRKPYSIYLRGTIRFVLRFGRGLGVKGFGFRIRL